MRNRERVLSPRTAAVLAAAVGLLVIAAPIPPGQTVLGSSHENASVWRAQIELTTGDVGDAGTDGWCVAGLRLFLNGGVIYSHTIRSGSTRCVWMDTGGGRSIAVVEISGGVLRASPEWQGYRRTFPSPVIPRQEVESRIEGMVGHHLTTSGKKVKWGKLRGRGVEAKRRNDTTLDIDLDLKYPVRLLPDMEVDVNFDLAFSCSAGIVSVAVQNMKVNVDSSWLTEFLSLGVVEFLDRHMSRQIAGAMRRQLSSISGAVNPGQPLPACPQITVQSSADVVFRF